MTKELHDKIVSLIPSESLRDAITESLSDLTLIAAAVSCAPDHFSRLRLLGEISDEVIGILKDYAIRLAETQQMMYCEYMSEYPGAVFELHIKERPVSYEERYLCADYDTAVQTIFKFYDSYRCSETDTARYSIVKRRVLTGEQFSEDWLGEAELLPGGILYRVYTDGYTAVGCSDTCDVCRNPCINGDQVEFPRFTEDGDAVRYRTNPFSIPEYGVVRQWDGAPTHECYVIPLEGDRLRCRDHANAHNDHEHIPAVFTEKIDPASLPEKMQDDYLAYLKYIKEENL